MVLLLMPTQIIAISLCTIISHSHKSIELLPCSISIHKTSNNVDDDCNSKNPIPKGTSWHLFSFFLNFIHEFPYMCVCFGPIYPKNVVFEGPKKSFIRNYFFLDSGIFQVNTEECISHWFLHARLIGHYLIWSINIKKKVCFQGDFKPWMI